MPSKNRIVYSLIAYLLRLGIAMLLGGAALLLGESNTKDTQKISVGSLGINMGLNQGLPLLHHGTKLVGGEVHTVELCQAILALHIFAYKLEFLVRPLCVLKINKQSILINADPCFRCFYKFTLTGSFCKSAKETS